MSCNYSRGEMWRWRVEDGEMVSDRLLDFAVLGKVERGDIAASHRLMRGNPRGVVFQNELHESSTCEFHATHTSPSPECVQAIQELVHSWWLWSCDKRELEWYLGGGGGKGDHVNWNGKVLGLSEYLWGTYLIDTRYLPKVLRYLVSTWFTRILHSLKY